MGIVMMVIALLLLVKITGFALKMCGTVLGILFSFIGFGLSAAFAVLGLGMAIVLVPVYLIFWVIIIFKLIF